jgi:hypothetical protein
MVRLLATELRMTDYVLTGLVKRRAELAGEIEATHDRLRKMIEELEKLDSVILQFNPSHQVESIKPKAFRPPSDWSHRGEMTKAVLSILPLAAEPLMSRDIALELLVTRALDKDDQKLLALMTVGVTLRLQRVNGIVRSASGSGKSPAGAARDILMMGSGDLHSPARRCWPLPNRVSNLRGGERACPQLLV